MLNRFTIKQKFIILALVVLTPLFCLLGVNIQENNADIKVIRVELEGLDSINSLIDLIGLIQNHRGLMNTYLSGDKSIQSKIMEIESKVDLSIADAQKHFKTHPSAFRDDASWKEFEIKWNDNIQNYQALNIQNNHFGAQDNFAGHTDFVNFLIESTTNIADLSGLTLDPNENTYYMIDTAILKTPAMIESFAKTRGLGAGILARKQLTVEEKSKLLILLNELAIAEKRYQHNLGVLKKYPEDSRIASEDIQAMVDAGDSLRQLTNTHILLPKTPDYDSVSFFKQATQNVNQGFDSYSKIKQTPAEYFE